MFCLEAGTKLTVGAASSNMMAQVEALFPDLSEITPAKIPPANTHTCTNTHVRIEK